MSTFDDAFRERLKRSEERRVVGMEATIRLCHNLLHDNEQGLAQTVLCIAVGLLDHDPIELPKDAEEALQAALMKYAIRRAKADCKGSA